MSKSIIKLAIASFILLIGVQQSNCQSVIADTLKTGTIEAQINTLEARTKTYDNFRAIREDYFQTFNRNVLDSLNKEKKDVKAALLNEKRLNSRIDSLNKVLSTTNANLDATIKAKNSMNLFGTEIGKALYNTILISTIGILLALLIIGLIVFNKNNSVARNTKTEYDQLSSEYEEYKKRVRIEREKANVEHFREIQKLKGIK